MLQTLGSVSATQTFTQRADDGTYDKESYGQAANFMFTEVEFADLADLAQVIEVLREDTQAFIVRGAPTEAVRAKVAANPRHKSKRWKDARGGDPATLVEVMRQWVVIDLDDWPLRPQDDLAADPASAIEHALRTILPAEFHGADCFWQLSSSAGMGHRILKVHAFYMLSEPAFDEHVKAVLAEHAPDVDGAPFVANQAIYTADPVINTADHQRAPDPLPQRTGWVDGTRRAVTLPALTPAQPRQVRTTPTGPRKQGAAPGATGAGGGTSATLAELGDGPGRRGFHKLLLAETMRYAGRCAAGDDTRDDNAEIDRLRGAVLAAPRGESRSPESVATYAGDACLRGLIESAFVHVANQQASAPVAAITPRHPMPTQSVADARLSLAAHMRAFFERVWAWHMLPDHERRLPEHAGIMTAVGTGKSTVGRELVLWLLRRARDAGMKPDACNSGSPTAQKARGALSSCIPGARSPRTC